MPQYPASIDLQLLTAATGYVFRSGDAADWFSLSVAAAGDVNGDGAMDLLFGAPGHHLRENRPSPPVVAGASFLVFGGTARLAALDVSDGSADGIIDLSLMTAAEGYRLALGAVGDASGAAVSAAGNVDGVAGDDILIGSPRSGTGVATLVSGGANLALLDAADGAADGSIDLGAVDGALGYQFGGHPASGGIGIDVAGTPDLDGDGIGDLLVGAHLSDRPGATDAGEAALIFGGAARLAALEVADGAHDGHINLGFLNGSNGYLLQGTLAGDNAGFRVRGIADVNGDGIADILVGAYQTPAAGLGETYLLFGGSANLAALDIAGGGAADGRIAVGAVNGSTGYRFESADDGDQMGLAISAAGDVNADGVGDLIIGDPFSDPFGITNAGDAYLVFGGAANLAALDAADGTTDGIIDLDFLDGLRGFRISGTTSEWIGQSVAAAGDVNGDGFGDILVGANFRQGRQGAAYVLFGGSGLGIEDAADGVADGRIRMSSFSGVGGFRMDGVDAGDQAGFAVAGLGDIDGDGLAEVMIGGVRDATTIPGAGDGEAYVVFSRLPDAAVFRTGTGIGQTLVGGNFDDTLSGLGGNDRLVGHGGADTLDGGTGADTLIGGAGNDRLVVNEAGDVLVEGSGGGTDTVVSAITLTLGVNLENLTLSGNAGIDGTGNAVANVITGNGGANELAGGGGADTLLGGGGSDLLAGGIGADSMVGGAGNERYVVDNLGDVVVEQAGEGNDIVVATVDWTLGNNLETLQFTGTLGLTGTGNGLVNRLVGNAGANLLRGLVGNDALLGGDGADTLDGGGGRDVLTGGAGADFFLFANAAEGPDKITDFVSGTDVFLIDASGFGGGLVPGALDPERFVAHASSLATSAAGVGQFIHQTNQAALLWDADGAGGVASVRIAVLTGGPGAGVGDFLLV